jgi:hypothetical protein
VRIIIATTVEPFARGGDAVIVDSLEEMLIRAGHEVETFRFPFRPRYSEMGRSRISELGIAWENILPRLLA